MYTVKKYTADFYGLWNEFNTGSKNGTFLFHRDFMEYHSDRFNDHSLLIFDGGKLMALLPANVADGVVYSHQGLTYGGLVYNDKIRLPSVLFALRAVLEFLHSNQIITLQVKLIPSIYHKFPAEELNYALFTVGGTLVRRDSLSVYSYNAPLAFTKVKKECIRRGVKKQLVIVEEYGFEIFWNRILIPNLQNKHGIKPVHTLAEIESLHKKFPDNIRHFNVYYKGEIVAGTTVFVTDTVAHPQYISGQADKNALGSLDYLYAHLITEVFKDKQYFDFGISNEQGGMKLNEGLVFWKESFGARTVVQDFFEVATVNFQLLDTVLI